MSKRSMLCMIVFYSRLVRTCRCMRNGLVYFLLVFLNVFTNIGKNEWAQLHWILAFPILIRPSNARSFSAFNIDRFSSDDVGSTMSIIIVVWISKTARRSVAISNISTSIFVRPNGSPNGTNRWNANLFQAFTNPENDRTVVFFFDVDPWLL